MRTSVSLTAIVATAAVGILLSTTPTEAPSAEKAGSLTQVGHEPLQSRGMNAALAINGD